MASTPLTLLLLTLIPFLIITSQTLAKTAPSHSHSPSPSPSPSPSTPINITAILEKSGGQFTILIATLNNTKLLPQIQSELNSTSQGFTLFAPTNNAFQNLKPGALNKLTPEQENQLILYHVTPKYYSQADFLTVSNPVKTQAPWGLNFTGKANEVNISTGVVTTRVGNALRQEFPLAVYLIEQLLLPVELFGGDESKAPTPAPSPKHAKTPSIIYSPPAPTPEDGPAPGLSEEKHNDAGGRNIGGFGLVLGFCLICMGILLA